jgi:hypothetical protein
MFYSSLAETQKSYRDRVKDILNKDTTLPASKREVLQIFDYLAEQHADDVRACNILDKVVKANVSRRKYEKIMLAAAKELMNRGIV